MEMRAILREAEIAFGVFELKAVGEMVAKGAWLQNTRIQGSPEAGAHSRWWDRLPSQEPRDELQLQIN